MTASASLQHGHIPQLTLVSDEGAESAQPATARDVASSIRVLAERIDFLTDRALLQLRMVREAQMDFGTGADLGEEEQEPIFAQTVQGRVSRLEYVMELMDRALAGFSA